MTPPRPDTPPPTLPHLGARPAGEPLRVLMVCMGNICRSPTAHGVLEKMVADAGLAHRIQVDSAGTHDYHVGEPPDRRAQAHALRRGYNLSAQRARHLERRDFADFDLVLVMDDRNESAARGLCPPAQRERLRRLTDFCRHATAHEVPDPYYGGADGFEHVLDVVEDACAGLLAALEPAPSASGPGATA
ncbi:protein-tyrosine phosphatase [Paracidovorax anthurii]|uniref:Protein-tyrosine phosphatase n=2 Tax=Paracidovorax anthurii TaxID=78229 RepID=A0A328YYZ1_9BURK|nr:protein-tyrosine phosphatase [Paracidovorax anthurii]